MTSRILVIADDFTGATDIGAAFVETGRSVLVHLAEQNARPSVASQTADSRADVEIFALKTRSNPVDEAVASVKHALELANYDPSNDQLYFKYCSTFDSTAVGNIGPVLDVLQQAAGAKLSVVVPAYPGNGRTQFQGYLFVNDRLLAESHMRNHPITPMLDSSVLRLLAAQTSREILLVTLDTVRKPNLEHALTQDREAITYAVVDAVDDGDLSRIAEAVQSHPLVSGGAGLAGQYPATGPAARAQLSHIETSSRVVIAGSQSAATQRQLAALKASGSVEVFVVDVADDVATTISECRTWFNTHLGNGKTLLVQRPELDDTSSSDATQAEKIESVLAAAAQIAYEGDVREFLVAGGESSASVVKALQGRKLVIGPNIDEGVPWCAVETADGSTVNIALKSGNFGADDFFIRGWKVLDS